MTYYDADVDAWQIELVVRVGVGSHVWQRLVVVVVLRWSCLWRRMMHVVKEGGGMRYVVRPAGARRYCMRYCWHAAHGGGHSR